MYIFTPLNQILFRKWLKPIQGAEDTAAEEKKAEKSPEAMKQKRVTLVNESKSGIKVIFKRLDELILKPLLIRDYEKRYVGGHNIVKNWSRKKTRRRCLVKSDGPEVCF